MATEKQVKLGVDDSGMGKLRSSAQSLAQDMIRSSRQYSTSSKEVLRDLEEQIRAIERRNKLDADYQRQQLTQARQAGTVSPEQFRRQAGAIRQSTEEDKLQVSLLRDLIETVKQTSKEEIREDRQTVERRIRESRRVESLSPSGDAMDILRETIQYGLIGDVTTAEREQRTGFRDRAARYGSGVNQGMGTIAGAQNEMFLAGAVLGLTPIIGMGLSQLFNRVVSSASGYETGLRGLATTQRGMTQGSSRDWIQRMGNAETFSKMGMTPADVASSLAGYRTDTANRVGNQYALQMMAAERAVDIDQGMMRGLASIMRYSDTERSEKRRARYRQFGFEMGAKEKTLLKPWETGYNQWKEREDVLARASEFFDEKEGAPERKDVAYSDSKRVSQPRTTVTGVMEAISIFDRSARGNNAIIKEMLGTFQNVSNQILDISGNISMTAVASGVAGIGAATGTEGRQLGRVVGGIQGLGRTQNPIIRSMMLRSLRQSSPDASFFDIQAAMEKPMQNLGAVSRMFGNLKQMTGGGELYKQALFSTFGGQLSRTDINQILEDGGSFEDIDSKARDASRTPVRNFSRDLPNILGKLEQSTARVESYTQELGKSTVEFIDKSLEALKDGINTVFGEDKQALKSSIKDGVKEGLTEYNNTNPRLGY